MNNSKLECPNCNYTIEIDRWNIELENSVRFGRAEELIPDNINPENWEEYRMMHGGIVDCPKCGEVCNFDDMNIY